MQDEPTTFGSLRPAWSDGESAVFHGDAIQTLVHLARDGFVADALVADPPYCSGGMTETARRASPGLSTRSSIKHRGWFDGDQMGTAGLAFTLRSVAWHARAILRESGHILLFADWRMIASLIPAIESAGVRFRNLLVWDKLYPALGHGFRYQHEMVLHFTVGKRSYYGPRRGNVLRCKRVPGIHRRHPTEKPVELLEEIIRATTPPGGCVVDPFCGSGSTLAAARHLGLRFVGVDGDGDHVTTAIDRVAPLSRCPPLTDTSAGDESEANP